MKRPATTESIVALLEEATLNEASTLSPTDDLVEIAGWDSMGMVLFIGLVRENFQVTLSVADIRENLVIAKLSELVLSRIPG